jgi:hypothetical protein
MSRDRREEQELQGMDGTTDEAGVAVFCSVVPEQELTLDLMQEGSPARVIGTFKLKQQQNEAVVLRVNR